MDKLNTVTVREMRYEDITAVLDIIDGLNEPVDIAEMDLYDGFKDSHIKPKYFVAEIDGKVVGVVGINDPRLNFGTAVIFWLMVQIGLHDKGIGTSLMNAVISFAKENPDNYFLLLSAKRKPFFKNSVST